MFGKIFQLEIVRIIVLFGIFGIAMIKCGKFEINTEVSRRWFTTAKKRYCHHKGRAFEPGEVLFIITECEIWICRNDTLRYGHVEVLPCLTMDYRVFPRFHDACINYTCDIYEVDTNKPYIIPFGPLHPNPKERDMKLWTSSFY